MNSNTTHYSMLSHISQVLHNNAKYIYETIGAWTLFITSTFFPKMLSLSFVFLSIGDYVKDIQAITAIIAGLASLLTLIKVILELKDRK